MTDANVCEKRTLQIERLQHASGVADAPEVPQGS